MSADEGYVDFRGHRTWYRVVGDLEAARAPLLALHGGPGSTHHYFAPLEQLQMMRFKDESWELFGPLMSGEKGS